MKYKMQVLYFSKAGNTEKMAQAIGKSQKAKSDKIPPAYPVEGQKLILIGLELGKGSVDKQVKDFINDLKPERTKNVAFFVTGNVSALEELKDILKHKGVNVLDDVYACEVKGWLFRSGKVTDEDIQAVVKWADKVTDSLVD